MLRVHTLELSSCWRLERDENLRQVLIMSNALPKSRARQAFDQVTTFSPEVCKTVFLARYPGTSASTAVVLVQAVCQGIGEFSMPDQ